MCALPIVSGSEVTTQVGGTHMDSNAFRQAALAPGRIAAAVGQDVGGLFQDVSQKIQQNRNADQVFKADLAMRKTKDNFTAELAKMPDPGTWLPAWKQQVDQQRDAVMNSPHAGPEVKRQLGRMFNVWEAATTSEIRTQALRKSIADSKENAITDSTYAAHQGDIDGAQTILKAAVENHAMSQADANRLGSRFPSIAAQAQADTAISTNPIKAPELIKRFEGTIEPRVYVAVEARARSAMHAAQAENLNDFAGQMDNSPDGTIDPKQLDAAVKDGQITAKMAEGLNARMKKEGIAHAKDDRDVLMSRADDHDWTQDKTPQETAKGLKEDGAHLPPALRKQVFEHIDKLMKAAKKEGAKEEKPVESDIFSRGKQDFALGVFRPATQETVEHWFKPDETKTVTAQPRHGWEADVSDNERRTAELNYARWQDKMRGFFKQNPEATSEQAQTFSNEVMRPLIEAQVQAALSPQPASKPAGA